MDPEYTYTQQLINQLRTEIQSDRIATSTIIQEGFNRMTDALSKHADSDSEQFLEVTERIATVSTKTNTIGAGLWGLTIAFVGAVFSWVFSHFQ